MQNKFTTHYQYLLWSLVDLPPNDGCLIWPFAKSTVPTAHGTIIGYGKIYLAKYVPMYVHRLVYSMFNEDLRR